MTDTQIVCKISGKAINTAVREALRNDTRVQQRVDEVFERMLGPVLEARITAAVEHALSTGSLYNMVRTHVEHSVSLFATQQTKDAVKDLVREIVKESVIDNHCVGAK